MTKLLNVILNAVRENRPIKNPEEFMDSTSVQEFAQVFDCVRELPFRPPNQNLDVWVEFGPEDSDGPLQVKVISEFARSRGGAP